MCSVERSRSKLSSSWGNKTKVGIHVFLALFLFFFHKVDLLLSRVTGFTSEAQGGREPELYVPPHKDYPRHAGQHSGVIEHVE